MNQGPTPYNEFRTGLTFTEVRRMLWLNSEDNRNWKHVTRHTVLGKWHQIKLEMYHEYLHYNFPEPEEVDIPF
jgi:hypothetical protein